MSKIFISGMISADPDYYARFCHAEQQIYHASKVLGNDNKVYNPARLIDVPKHRKFFNKHNASNPKKVWRYFMRRALAMLNKCDTVLFLSGWEYSPGARIEHSIAVSRGMAIHYQDGKK